MVAGSAEGSDGQARRGQGQGMGIFEMAADNDYMYIYKYRTCKFEVAAAGPAEGSRHAARQRGL